MKIAMEQTDSHVHIMWISIDMLRWTTWAGIYLAIDMNMLRWTKQQILRAAVKGKWTLHVQPADPYLALEQWL